MVSAQASWLSSFYLRGLEKSHCKQISCRIEILTGQQYKCDGNSEGASAISVFVGVLNLCCELTIACLKLHICFKCFMYILPLDVPEQLS